MILPLLLVIGGGSWYLLTGPAGQSLPSPFGETLANLTGANADPAALPRASAPAVAEAAAAQASPSAPAASRIAEGDRLMAEGRWAAAAAAYAEVARSVPTSAIAHTRWARALVYANKNTEGLQRAQQAVDIDPRLAEAQATLALAHDWSGNPDRAITAARRAAELDQHLPEAHAFLAEAYADKYRLREADEAIERALSTPNGRDHPEVLRVQGYLQETKADYPTAVATYRKAVERAPERSYLWLNLGHALRVQKQYEEAIRAFQQANDLNPRDARAEGGLGMVYYALEEYPSAQSHLERSVEIDASYATGYGQLGWVFYVQKAYDRAQPFFEKAVEMEKNPSRNAAYRHALGWTYLSTRQPERARVEFTKALEQNPGLEGAREGLQAVERAAAAPDTKP